MASSPDSISMALFCDFENVALGVRDAKYEKFDIKRVLERLLLKGSIVVKKAYCDWERYKSFKAAMHEANFELIEIPHVRQSGKNSADIRLVVDALDLCYTKSHVDTFVIISGDSDFSPLVSKLRENAKQVIGVGVKQSTSDLLIANCDEFIFYDDLVRDSQRAAAKREARDNPPASRRAPEEERARREELESRRSKAIDIAVETFDALLAERGESGKIWSSMLKEAIKRRKPDFNESYFGFRAFGNLLEEAQARGLLELGRDEKSGTFVMRPGPGVVAARMREEFAGAGEPPVERTASAADEAGAAAAEDAAGIATPAAVAQPAAAPEARRGRGRGRAARQTDQAPVEAATATTATTASPAAIATQTAAATPATPAAGAEAAAQPAAAAVAAPEPAQAPAPKAAAAAEPEGSAAARPAGTRRRGGSKTQAPAPEAQEGDAAGSTQPAPRRARGGRSAAARADAAGALPPQAGAAPASPAPADSAPAAATPAPAAAAAVTAAAKPPARPRRARKPKADPGV